jgi:ABC-type branched-subunit amino acid transport system ATPase component/predicted MFS family arabinose efflux permease
LSNFGFANLVAINGLVGIALIPVVGWLGDRSSRVNLVRIAVVLLAIGGAMVGLAPVVWVLLIGRILCDAGKFVPDTIHNTLIADMYVPAERPVAFSLHRAGYLLGLVIAPLFAALIGKAFGWRAVFLGTVPTCAIAILLAMRLRDPVRGGTEAVAGADELIDEAPVPYATAVRQLMRIRTLRRVYLAGAFYWGSLAPYLTFAAIFLSVVYGTGLAARGFISAGTSVAGFLGVFLGGPMSRRALERGLQPLQRLVGLVTAAAAVAMLGLALSPNLPFAIAMIALINLTFALNTSAGLVVGSMVAPPRLRSVAFSFGGMAVLIGLLVNPVIGSIVDRNGVRVGMLACIPSMLIGSYLFASAGRFATADHREALRTIEVAARLRRERLDANSRSLLVVRGLYASYGKVPVLTNIDLDVREGEAIALLGTNGAGKSTLLKAIVGVVTPSDGDVFFDGQDIAARRPWDVARLGIVMMPGGKSVFPRLTVRENLKMAAWGTRRRGERVNEARIGEVLDLFPSLSMRLDELAGNLSGGEQQQVSLAQAFIPDPHLLMIDELSLGLSPIIVAQMVELLQRLRAADPRLTLVVVEQSVNVAMQLADRAVFMEKGEIRFDGLTSDLLERPDVLRAVFLRGAEHAEQLR